MNAPVEKTWVGAQEVLRGRLNPDLYSLWFQPIKAVAGDTDTLTLEVANDFCEVWLKDNYLDLIRAALIQSSGREWKVKFRVNAAVSASALPADAIVKPKTAPETPERSPGPAREMGFNPKYTFDAFVVGENNNHAHAAAHAVAQAPGHAYNPLFFHGGVGLGKTHLLHAIGQHVGGSKRSARIMYLSAERFTNEYIDAIQNNLLVKFRRKYRQADLLLIDDVQFLSGKERIQEEFFHTFNALHDSHKQIVLTCDRPAAEIQGLEQRLVSRFEWGLVSEIQPPDVETRMAILRKKAAGFTVEIPEEVISFVATRIRSNIRRLEGALNRVASYATLSKKKLTVPGVEVLLREVLHEEGRHNINIETIQRRVADHFDIRLADMTSKRRPENIAFPRQIAMYLARQMTDSSLNTIGESFGGRDHGTVLHACRLVKDRMEVDAHVRQVVGYLEKQLQR